MLLPACSDAERAEAAAKEEMDKRVQKSDPKASLAWKRGGESRVSTGFSRIHGGVYRVYMV